MSGRDAYDAERRRIKEEQDGAEAQSRDRAEAHRNGVGVVARVHAEVIAGTFLRAAHAPQALAQMRRVKRRGYFFRQGCWEIDDHTFVIWRNGHWHYGSATFHGPGGENQSTLRIGRDSGGFYSRGDSHPTIATVEFILGRLARYMARHNIPYPD
jgi:hypothetical protein